MSLTAAPPESPPTQPGPGPAELPQRPSPRRPVLRMLLGCLIALLCSAGIAATFVLEQVHTLRDALSQNSALSLPSNTLAPAGWGQPETLLLVGDDQRALTKYYHQAVLPHSNEMLLVRIDPSKPWISMMSIPRELEATILPANGVPVTTRFNYAYTAGGIPLLVSTIKRVLGLDVNHVMVITFGRFRRAIDELGCVYSTVDRRYYHVNVLGGQQYQEIDLQPGYQDMCGMQALEFVSYRHDDTSLVRDARDQSLLLDAKQQYGPTLADNVDKFERIFGQAVQTDRGLQSTNELLNLIGTLITSAGRRVRQVKFQVNLAPGGSTPCACVTATSGQIAASVSSFLHGGTSLPKQRVAAQARAVQSRAGVAQQPLVATPTSQLAQARTAAAQMPFTYEYPSVQDRGGSVTPVYLRQYGIGAPGNVQYPIYVAVFSAGQLGQYYDVQGTTWTTAPILDSPEQTIRVGGRTYYLHYAGEQLQTVAWEEHGAAYWIRNSLSDVLPNGELLAIAEQTQPLTATGPGSGAPVKLSAAAVPQRTTPPASTGVLQTIGSVGGLLTLVAAPGLIVLLIRRRRELGGLRAQLRSGFVLEARLLAALPAGARTAPLDRAVPPAFRSERTHPGLRPRRRPLIAGVLVALIVAGAGVGYVLTRGTQRAGGSAAPSSARAGLRAAAPRLPVPTVAVAVLNSSSTAGAARTLARQLQRRGVNVTAVGNLAESRPAGLWILYTPGRRTAASQLARLLGGRAATIAPIDPQTEAAAGVAPSVVLVIA